MPLKNKQNTCGRHTHYTAEKKKIEKTIKKTGGDADEIEDVIESKLFYYNEMSFLDQCIVHRPGSNNFKVKNIHLSNNLYLFNIGTFKFRQTYQQKNI